MATKFLTLEQLKYYNNKVKDIFVQKELKTDSEDEYKVLSDNNLTDELVQKIHSAADSGFNGAYSSLTGKPTIDGHELSADSTAKDLGLAKTSDLPKIATTAEVGTVKPDGETITIDVDGTVKVNELSSYAKKTDLPTAATTEKAGIVKPDGTSVKVTGDGSISVDIPDTSDMLTKTDASKEYLTQTNASSTYATQSAIEDMATKTELADYAKKTDITGVYTPKGSVAFDGLPTPSVENVGFVYDVNEQFETDSNFNDQGKSYPAGTNVVVVDNGDDDYKYDVLSGSIDLSGYMLKSDVETISSDEIDALFSV